ncbi:MAG TPA: SpvB/TcaC N-terminal domain-containing protein, partial [Candidatus Nanopelagicales bacterium]|nr:SpvB/TcaC N-terminal domain-containing protein [Candidatus Nanopelagicales bacterium]
PRYDDAQESDTFVLSGAEDLVPALLAGGTLERFDDAGETVQRYRPRVEGLFARIERRWKAGEAPYWKITTRDNVTSIYGRSEQARIADPSAPRRVFSWLLEETRDDRGNVITYEYKPEDLAGVPRDALHEAHRHAGAAPITNRYLKRIRYGNTTPGDPSTMLFEVVFDYGEHDPLAPTPEDTASAWPPRQDPFSTYRAGFEIRTYRLCRRVLMFHRMPELGAAPCLVRSTDLAYADSPVLTQLVAVTHSGYIRDPATLTYQKRSFPPLELGYSQPDIHHEIHTLDEPSMRDLAGSLASAAQWVDLDGEGLPGLLVQQQAGALLYKRNLGGGVLSPARPLSTRPSMTQGSLQVMDIDGDGQKEMVFFERPLSGYFDRTEEGSWAPFRPLAGQPTIGWSDPDLQFIDLNGDGLEDVLIAQGATFTWYPSRAKGGFDKPITLDAPREGMKGPILAFADGTSTVFFADMSGDGLVDLVRVRNGHVCYWPNLGHGRFGAGVQMNDPPWLDHPD